MLERCDPLAGPDLPGNPYQKEFEQRFPALGSLEKMTALKALLGWGTDAMVPSLRLELILGLFKVRYKSSLPLDGQDICMI